MFQDIRKNMQDMTVEEKISYYVQYYGWWTVGVIAVVSIVIFLAVHFLTNPDIVSGILVINSDGEKPVAVNSEYFNGLLKEHGIDPKKNTILINSSMHVIDDYEDSVTRTNIQTVYTMFETRSVDIVFSDEEFFKAIWQSGFFADLSDYISEDVLKNHQSEIVYILNTDTGDKVPAGIRVHQDTVWIKDVGWYKSEAVVGLMDSMKNEELAIDILLKAIGED